MYPMCARVAESGTLAHKPKESVGNCLLVYPMCARVADGQSWEGMGIHSMQGSQTGLQTLSLWRHQLFSTPGRQNWEIVVSQARQPKTTFGPEPARRNRRSQAKKPLGAKLGHETEANKTVGRHLVFNLWGTSRETKLVLGWASFIGPSRRRGKK